MNSTILLRNACVRTLALQVEALADSASLYLCIPQRICERLRLEKADERVVMLADGSSRRVGYVGPVEIRFGNRAGFAGALVMGDQVLVGALPMQEMDLVVVPGTRRLDARAPGAGEPPGRYVLPPASRAPRSSPSAGSPAARSLARSRASPLP